MQALIDRDQMGVNEMLNRGSVMALIREARHCSDPGSPLVSLRDEDDANSLHLAISSGHSELALQLITSLPADNCFAPAQPRVATLMMSVENGHSPHHLPPNCNPQRSESRIASA